LVEDVELDEVFVDVDVVADVVDVDVDVVVVPTDVLACVDDVFATIDADESPEVPAASDGTICVTTESVPARSMRASMSWSDAIEVSCFGRIHGI